MVQKVECMLHIFRNSRKCLQAAILSQKHGLEHYTATRKH